VIIVPDEKMQNMVRLYAEDVSKDLAKAGMAGTGIVVMLVRPGQGASLFIASNMYPDDTRRQLRKASEKYKVKRSALASDAVVRLD